MFSLETQIAMRYLFSKKKDGFISLGIRFSILGMILGVAALIIVMSVMNGYRTELLNMAIGFNGHITIYPQQSGNSSLKDLDDITAKIKIDNRIIDVVPMIEKQAILTHKNEAIGAVIRGMSFTDLAKKPLISEHILYGNMQDCQQDNSIMLGIHMALGLRAKVGDKVKLVTSGGVQTIMGQIPRTKDYILCAVFKTGMYVYDNMNAFISMQSAMLHFNTSEPSKIEVETNNRDQANQISKDLKKILPNYYITDWENDNASMTQALEVEKTVMFLILTLIICVAAFNIISSMVMMVHDKNKDIAILKTIGLSDKSIIRIFLNCGILTGFIGTFLGIILGILIAVNLDNIKCICENITGTAIFDPVVYYLSQLPSEIHVIDIVKVSSMTIIVSILASIYPAWRAAKLDPIVILRKL